MTHICDPNGCFHGRDEWLHNEVGLHVPPRMCEWVDAADPIHQDYDPLREIRGAEVEKHQRLLKAYAEHLALHRRRGEPTTEAPMEEWYA